MYRAISVSLAGYDSVQRFDRSDYHLFPLKSDSNLSTGQRSDVLVAKEGRLIGVAIGIRRSEPLYRQPSLSSTLSASCYRRNALGTFKPRYLDRASIVRLLPTLHPCRPCEAMIIHSFLKSSWWYRHCATTKLQNCTFTEFDFIHMHL